MEPTLAHLRLLLQRARDHRDSAALLRLPKHEHTVLGLCLNYIGGESAVLLLAKRAGERRWANLSEPMRARALLVALALALGLDPGVGALSVMWYRDADTAWNIAVVVGVKVHLLRFGEVFLAAEPDPFKALVLAALHVLEVPRG